MIGHSSIRNMLASATLAFVVIAPMAPTSASAQGMSWLWGGGSQVGGSGKEVVAFAVKSRRLGTLVGERTAGAVLGGRPFLLSDRSLLYLATLDVEVNGVRLEGVGVQPDIWVQDDLPYAGGRDPQLDAAVACAAGG